LQEKILVVPKESVLQKNVDFQGFRPGTDQNLWTHFAAEGLFLVRDSVEYDTRYKQLIVYLVLRHREEIFIYQRIRATGEKRLLDKYSFGLGGHINPVHSCSFRRLIASNLARELKEEVSFPGPYSYRFLGFLNDEEEEVGRYHFGLVFLVSCLSPQITVRALLTHTALRSHYSRRSRKDSYPDIVNIHKYTGCRQWKFLEK
jgi:predicted NUDIX family phosphoesterase